MVDSGRGIDQTDHQREGGRRSRVYAKEASSIQHIKIPMVNKKAVKFRCVGASAEDFLVLSMAMPPNYLYELSLIYTLVLDR